MDQVLTESYAGPFCYRDGVIGVALTEQTRSHEESSERRHEATRSHADGAATDEMDLMPYTVRFSQLERAGQTVVEHVNERVHERCGR